MTLDELDTPALIIDLDRTESNLDRASRYADEHGLGMRPHTKTHKSPRLAQMQIDRGAHGITVAKVGEAEVMSAGEPPSILVAYPVWGDSKWARLVSLSKRVPLTVALDNADVASGLSRHAAKAGITIRVLAEVDVGMRRCGYPPGGTFQEFTRSLAKMHGLELDGLMFYPGHVQPSEPGGSHQLDQLAVDLDVALEGMRRDGLSTAVVSGGSTPTLYHSHRLTALTEIRPGTYVFNDRMQVALEACGWDDCAGTVLTTVVSRPNRNTAIIDSGSKTFTSDPLRPHGDGGFGRVLGLPRAHFGRMSEEHGMLDLRDHEGDGPRIGDRLRIIPNHICVTVNMHETAFGVRGESVECSWPVEGRGKLQ